LCSGYFWRNALHVGVEVRGPEPLAGASEGALRGDEVREAEQDPGDKFADDPEPAAPGPHRAGAQRVWKDYVLRSWDAQPRRSQGAGAAGSLCLPHPGVG